MESQAWVRVAPGGQSCQLVLQCLPCIRPPPTLSSADPGPRSHHLPAECCGGFLTGLPASALGLSSFCTRQPEQFWSISQIPRLLVPGLQTTPMATETHSPSWGPSVLCPQALPLSSPSAASSLFLRLPDPGPVLGCLHLLFPLPVCCSRSWPLLLQVSAHMTSPSPSLP